VDLAEESKKIDEAKKLKEQEWKGELDQLLRNEKVV
jgi:hypothetical protein